MNRRTSFILTRLEQVKVQLGLAFDALGISDNERFQREKHIYSLILIILDEQVLIVNNEVQHLKARNEFLIYSINNMVRALGVTNILDLEILLGTDYKNISSLILETNTITTLSIKENNNNNNNNNNNVNDNTCTLNLLESNRVLQYCCSVNLVPIVVKRLAQITDYSTRIKKLLESFNDFGMITDLLPAQMELFRDPSYINRMILSFNNDHENDDVINFVNENISLLDISNKFQKSIHSVLSKLNDEKNLRIETIMKLSSSIVTSFSMIGVPEKEIDVNILKVLISEDVVGTNSAVDHGVNYKISDLDIDFLKTLDENLKKEEQLRRNTLDGIKKNVLYLWDKLHESEVYICEFTGKNDNLKVSIEEVWLKELARLNIKKKEHVRVFIDDIINEIELYWNMLYLSDKERSKFSILHNLNIYNEELLEMYEVELERLKSLYELRKEILLVVDSFFDLEKDSREVEESMKDKSRLFRGKNYDPKRLLREEQLRIRISKRRPIVLSTLQSLIKEWNVTHKTIFLIQGRDFLKEIDFIIESEEGTRSRSLLYTPKSTKSMRNIHYNECVPLRLASDDITNLDSPKTCSKINTSINSNNCTDLISQFTALNIKSSAREKPLVSKKSSLINRSHSKEKPILMQQPISNRKLMPGYIYNCNHNGVNNARSPLQPSRINTLKANAVSERMHI